MTKAHFVGQASEEEGEEVKRTMLCIVSLLIGGVFYSQKPFDQVSSEHLAAITQVAMWAGHVCVLLDHVQCGVRAPPSTAPTQESHSSSQPLSASCSLPQATSTRSPGLVFTPFASHCFTRPPSLPPSLPLSAGRHRGLCTRRI